jgi:hypothetical protein
MEEIGPAEDGSGYQPMQQERSGEVAAEIVVVASVVSGLERRGYGWLLTSVSAG